MSEYTLYVSLGTVFFSAYPEYNVVFSNLKNLKKSFFHVLLGILDTWGK